MVWSNSEKWLKLYDLHNPRNDLLIEIAIERYSQQFWGNESSSEVIAYLFIPAIERKYWVAWVMSLTLAKISFKWVITL